MARILFLAASLVSASALVGCATLTNDANIPISFSMSDGSKAKCAIYNKRGNWSVDVPATPMIRRSDDALKYSCTTDDGRSAVGSIDSTVGAKIVASAVFIDFGITDAITDKHRDYPRSFVIPIEPRDATENSPAVPADTRLHKSKTDGSEYQARYFEQVKGIANAMACEDSTSFLKEDAGTETWLLDCGDKESLLIKCSDETCMVAQSKQ